MPSKPQYRSHKIVSALKIGSSIEVLPDGSAMLSIANPGFVPVRVKKEVIARYVPLPGDYFVEYEDGYHSISPGNVFEAGYTLITEGHQATNELVFHSSRSASHFAWRKKPIIIEAFEMTYERRQDNNEWPSWLDQAWQKEPHEIGSISPEDYPHSQGNDRLIIHTLEGRMLVGWGDYIIRGVVGEIYSCRKDIFLTTYEKV